MNPEEIASEIVNLTMILDNQEDLKEAWIIISSAMTYLSRKDDFFTAEVRVMEIIGKALEARGEEE
jgi:hypothetical protein